MTTRALRPGLLAGFLTLVSLTAGPAWATVRFVTAPCANSGAGSLRALIDAALSGDVIAVPFCTLMLAGTPNEDVNAGGDLDINNKTLTIIGVGPGRTIIDGGAIDRVFDILGISNVTLIGMTIRNGHPPNNGSGGGIRVLPTAALTLINVVVSGNQGDAGGGIITEGDVTLKQVILRDNSSFLGGGLASLGGNVLLTNSVIADNRTESAGGGIFNDGAMTIVASQIVRNLADSDNSAGGDGGGLFQLSSAQQTLRRTVLARNLVGSTGSGPDCFVNLGGAINALGATRIQTGCGVLTSLSVGDDRVGVNPLLPGDIVVGAGSGGGPHVRAFDPTTSAEVLGFFAYDPTFSGGARVAACDLTGDGVPNFVTGAGPGGGPHVRAFDGVDGAQLPGTVASFFAYNPAFPGGVFVGCADVNKDGVPDVITGPGAGGGPHVRAFSGLDGADFFNVFAFDPAFSGGVFVGP